MAVGGSTTNALVNKARGQCDRRKNGRSRVRALVTLAVVGGIALLLALVIGGNANAAPVCDGKTMTRDDVCVVYGRGAGTYSYEGMIGQRETAFSVMRGIGFGLAGLCAVLMIPAAVRLAPSRPWGTPAGGPCTRCRRGDLRKKRTTHSVSQGRTTYHYAGVVTLCTFCGFNSVSGR